METLAKMGRNICIFAGAKIAGCNTGIFAIFFAFSPVVKIAGAKIADNYIGIFAIFFAFSPVVKIAGAKIAIYSSMTSISIFSVY